MEGNKTFSPLICPPNDKRWVSYKTSSKGIKRMNVEFQAVYAEHKEEIPPKSKPEKCFYLPLWEMIVWEMMRFTKKMESLMLHRLSPTFSFKTC